MLYKRKNSQYWWYRFTSPDGRTVRESTKTKNRKKAEELADKHKALTWDQVKLGQRPQYLWEDAVLKWVSESTKRSISDDIVIFRYLDPFLAGKTLESIDSETVEAIITKRQLEFVPNTSRLISKGRINRITALIRSVLRVAEKNGNGSMLYRLFDV